MNRSAFGLVFGGVLNRPCLIRFRVWWGLALALTSPWVVAGPLAVVVAASSPSPRLNHDQVAAIFLGVVKTFPGGERATPVDQLQGSPDYDQFYAQVTEKTEAQVKAHWSRMIFTGKGAPPHESGDSAAVKKLVSGNPTLIGYIDAAAVDGSVKVVYEVK